MTTDARIPDLPEISHDHPDVTGGWLRPAVFGAMDGLVSNLALIAGVAGGTRDHTGSTAVVLAGLAGLAAGAFSMAAGEYTSVASQSEAAQREIDKERREIIANPDAEAGELAEMYVAKGIDPVLAAEVSRADPRERRERRGRARARGARRRPRRPGLADGRRGVVVRLVRGRRADPRAALPAGRRHPGPRLLVTLVALFACGAVVTQVTSRSWWYGGSRQMVLGAAAAGLTYLFGSLVGGAGIG